MLAASLEQGAPENSLNVEYKISQLRPW